MYAINPDKLPSLFPQHVLLNTNLQVVSVGQRLAEFAHLQGKLFTGHVVNVRQIETRPGFQYLTQKDGEELDIQLQPDTPVLRTLVQVVSADLVALMVTSVNASRSTEPASISLDNARRLLSVFGSLASGLIIEDEHRKLIFANQAFCDLFQIPATPHQLIGADCAAFAEQSKHAFIHPDAFIDGVAHLLKEKVKKNGEILSLKDGRTLHRDYLPIFLDNNYRGHLWNYVDVTESIAYRQALEDQRILYETILNEIPNDIAVFDKDHRYVFVNPVGIKDPELRKWIIGKTDEDYCIHKGKSLQIAENRKKLFQRVKEGRRQQEWVEELRSPDGRSEFHLRRMYPTFDSDSGEFKLMIGYGMNITDRIKIEQQIANSEAKYRRIFDYSRAIKYTHTLDGTFLDVNEAFTKLFGITRAQASNINVSSLIADEERFRSYLKAIDERGLAEGVFEVVDKDGNSVQLLYQNHLMALPEENKYVLGFAQDITSRVEMENELRTAKAEAEKLARDREIFVASISHEIRTPMNAIIGLSRILAKTELTQQQRSYLNTIVKASNNLLVIVSDLLDISRIDHGKLTLEHIGFNPANVISEAIVLLGEKAKQKGIEFKASSQPQLAPILMGDPTRLLQILVNILHNAIKFTAKGGVYLDTSIVDTNEAQTITFTVKDTGEGISEQYLQHVFDQFSQEHAGISRNYGGTGLGLAITKQLVDLMRGSITIASKKNVGTTISVTITFVLGSAEHIAEKPAATTDYKPIEGSEILVVEDYEMNRLLIDVLLTQYGARVTEAATGEDAIETLKKKSFDLILMDLRMPGMDGIQTTQVIRQQLGIDTPIIALTASTTVNQEIICRQAGMNDFLPKPFEESTLLDAIIKHLPANRPTRENVTQPLFSLTILEEMSRGNKEFTERMLRMFIDNSRKAAITLETAWKTGNLGDITSVVHKLRPSVQSFKLEKLVNTLSAIDRSIAENNAHALANNVKASVELITSITQEMELALLQY